MIDPPRGYLEDPRVLFAAERTLLAWVRTGITLMGLGFVVARFGVFLAAVQGRAPPPGHGLSAWIGIAFVLLAAIVNAVAVRQYAAILRTLGSREIPPATGPGWRRLLHSRPQPAACCSRCTC